MQELSKAQCFLLVILLFLSRGHISPVHFKLTLLALMRQFYHGLDKEFDKKNQNDPKASFQ